MQTSEKKIIIKANGEREFFDIEKLYTSLIRSGADESLAQKISSYIASSVQEDDKTQDIYKDAFEQLRNERSSIAARYSVKHALLELGPSGYPFEDFLCQVYKQLGYEARSRVIAQGRCVEHELDIVASKGEERLGAEVKFHNRSGIKSDLKVALYVHARFEDIAEQSGKGSETDFTDKLLITNTKFTQQVELYAACVGLRLVSWDYPAKGNLNDLIEETGVHPVSCLTTLSNLNKRRLMEQGIVLCRQMKERSDAVEALGLSDIALKKVFEEIHHLCV